MKTKTQTLNFASLPTDYPGLVAMLPPRVIHDKIDASNVEEMIFAMAGHDLSTDQSDYLDLLSDLHADYASKAGKPTKRTPLAKRVAYLIESAELSQSAFAKIADITQGHVSLILAGKRGVSKPSISKLCRHFKLSADYFLE